MTTATTIGYGDVPIDDRPGRMWASVHILISCALLGDSISVFDRLRHERRSEVKRLASLNHELTLDLLEALNMRAAALRPDVQRDAEGLSELEFVLVSCLELGLVELEHVQPFIAQFRALDVDGSGR